MLRLFFFLSLFLPNFGPVEKVSWSYFLIPALIDKGRISRTVWNAWHLLFFLIVVLAFTGFSGYNSKFWTQLLTIFYISFSFFIFGFVRRTSKDVDDLVSLAALLSLVSLVFYFFVGDDFNREVTLFFNNSNLYSVGGISSSWEALVLPRLNLFTPEPSFYAFLWSIVFILGWVSGAPKWKLALIFISVLFTISRTGYLILFVFFAIKYWRLIGIIFGFALPFFLTYLSTFEYDLSILQRFESLTTALKFWDTNYLFGSGWGGFFDFAYESNLDYKDIFNLHLRILVEAGLVGFILYVIFWTFIFYKVKKKFTFVILAILVGLSTFSAYNLILIWFVLNICIDETEESTN